MPQKLRNMILLLSVTILIVHTGSISIGSGHALTPEGFEDECEHSEQSIKEDRCSERNDDSCEKHGTREESIRGSYSDIQNDNCCGEDPNCWFRFDHEENEDISPDPAEVGETVTISGEIQHFNGQDHSQAVISLYIDGTEVDAHVTGELGWDDTESFSFERTKDSPGTYDVDLYVFYWDGGVVGGWHQRWSSSFEVVEEGTPEFELSGWSVEPDVVNPGETVTIEGEITNVGDETGDVSAELFIDGDYEATNWKTLDPSETETFTHTHSESEEGTYDVQISAWCGEKEETDDTWYGSFEVVEEGEPEFELSGWSVSPSTVQPDEVVTIEGEIENIGDETGTVYAELYIDGTYTASESDTLDPGQTETFTHTHSESEEGTYDVQISAWCGEKEETDDTWYGEFEVVEEEEAELVLQGWSVSPEVVGPGETVTIEGEVENIGGEEGSDDVDLYIDNTLEDYQSVTVGPGESTTVTFTHSEDDEGTYDVQVDFYQHFDDEWHGSFEVVEEDEPAFSLEDWSVNPEVVEPNEEVTIEGDIENVGNTVEDDIYVRYWIEGTLVDSVPIGDGFEPGESYFVSRDFTREDPGEYSVEVTAYCDAEDVQYDSWLSSFEVVEEELPGFELSGWSVSPSTVQPDEVVTIEGEVTNVGGKTGLVYAELYIDGTYTASESDTLDPGQTETFTHTHSESEVGTYDVQISAWCDEKEETDDTWYGSFEVVEEELPEFELSGWSVSPDVVNPGGTVTIEGEIENIGDETGDVSAELFIDGDYEASNWKTLDPGDTETFTHTHSESEVGTYDVQISAWCDEKSPPADDTWYSEFEVVEEEEAELVLQGWSVDPEVIEPGETVTIEGEVENIGGDTGSDYVDLYVDDMDEYEDYEYVELGPGESTVVSFYYDDTGDVGIYDVRVEFYQHFDDYWESEFEVVEEGEPEFELSGWSVTPDTVEPDVSVTIEGEITNVGSVTGTVYAELYIDNSYTASESDTLDPGETDTFTHTHSESEVGTYEVQISAWCDEKEETDDTWYGEFEVVEEGEPEFELSGWSVTPEMVEPDVSVTIEGEITNIGSATGTVHAELYIDDSYTASESDTLDPGETDTFTHTHSESEVGTYEVQISAWCDEKGETDDTWYGEFEVVEETSPPEFVLNDWSIEPDPAEIDEVVTIEGEVENIGEEEGETWIDLYVDDMENWVEFETVTLGPGQTEWLNFTGIPEDDWDIESAGIYDVKVEPYDWPENAWESQFEIVVEGEAFFSVYGVEAEDLVEGDDLEVSAIIENTGDESDTQTVEMTSGVGSDSVTVTLGPGENTGETFIVGTSSGDAGSYTAEVSSDDESDQDTFNVLALPHFAVYGVSANDVLEGNDLEVTATIENTGDVEDTQTVEMSSPVGSDTVTITLNGGERTTETFVTSTSEGDAGSYTAEVSSDDDSDSDTFEVIEETEEAHFQVYNVDAPDVIEGEDLEVTATIENMGEETATQTVEMSSPVGSDTVTITLNGGERTTETLITSTSEGDAGSYTAEVSSDDDSDQDDFEVKKPAYFEVEITGYEEEVVEGEEAVFEYEVTNTGDLEGTQDIEFYVDGSLLDTEEDVYLRHGEGITSEFTWRTEAGDAGDHDIIIESEDDDDGVTITVVEGAFFEIEIIDFDEEIVTGEELVVKYSVTNIGYDEGAQDIELIVDDVEEDSEFVMLSSGDIHRGEFTWTTEDTGEFDVMVASENDEEEVTVSVLEGGIFSVSIIDHDETVNEGDQVVIEYRVVNTGDERDTQDIEFKVDGTVINSRVLRLEGGSEEESQFVWDAEDPGEYNIAVSSEDDDDEVIVTVLGESIFEVQIIEYDETVNEGDQVLVTYEVTNTGDDEDTQEIRLTVDGDLKDSEHITLAGGMSYEAQLTWQTEDGDAGEREVIIASDDDEDEVTVTVAKDTHFEVEILSIEKAGLLDEGDQFKEGDELIVKFKVTNTGDLKGDQTIEFRVDGELEDSMNVTLGPGEYKDDHFIWESEGGDHELSIVSESDEASLEVEVSQDANLEVNIIGYEEEVSVGDEVVVQYTVTNTGSLGVTQTVEFIVGGDIKESFEVDLEEGELHEGEFSWIPEDDGNFILEVATEDDSQQIFLTVLKGAQFEVDLLEVDDRVVKGEEVVIEYTVTNIGDLSDTVEIEFVVYDEDDNIVFIDSEEITLGVDEEYEGDFRWEPEEAGDHLIVLMEERETITVEDESEPRSFFERWCSLWWLILLLIILFIVLLVIFVWRRKEEKRYPTDSIFTFSFWGEDEEEEDRDLRTLRSLENRDANRHRIDGDGTSRFVSTVSSETLGGEQRERDSFDEYTEEDEENMIEEETSEQSEMDESGVFLDTERDEEKEEPYEGSEEELDEDEEETMECPLCGNQISADADSCYACGKDFTDGEEEVSAEDEDVSEDDVFVECEKCGFLVTEDEDECPYCDTSL